MAGELEHDNYSESTDIQQQLSLNPILKWRSLAGVAFIFDLLMVFMYLTYIPSTQTYSQTALALLFPVLALVFSVSVVLLVGKERDNTFSKLFFICSRFERLGASLSLFRLTFYSIINGSSDEDVALTGFLSSVYLAFTLGNLMIFLFALFQRVRIVK